jgi:ribose transport system permease protein
MSNLNKVFSDKKNTDIARTGIDISKVFPYFGLIAVIVFFEIVSKGQLITPRSSTVLINLIFDIGLGTTGVLFLMAQGEMDFSLGGIVAFSGALAAIAFKNNPALLFPVALLSGLLVGLVNGLLIAKLHIPSFISTLSMSFVLRGITSVILGGNVGLPYSVNKLDNLQIKLFVLIAAMVVCFFVFNYTRFGKHSKAIGSLPEAARQSGVNIANTKLVAFIIAGVVSGLIGFFDLVRSCTASPTNGAGLEFNVVIALMVGGLSLTGGWITKFNAVVIGCIIMSILSLGFNLWGVDGYTQQLVQGIIFIVAVALSYDRKNAVAIK